MVDAAPVGSLHFTQADQLLRIATESLLDQVAKMCDGALIVDTQSRIVWMNERYPQRLGIAERQSVIGQWVENVLPNSQMRTVVETGRPIMLDIMDFGDESFVVVRLPLRDAQGTVIGAIGIMLLDDAMGLAPVVSRFNQLKIENAEIQKKLAQARRTKYTLASFIGNSEHCVHLKRLIRRAARSQAAVLIQGETGTGKELLAHALHNASDRTSKPFVAVNIAAIPEHLLESEFFGHTAGAFTGAERKGRDGKFKLADGGTLFLDEIGDMSVGLQAKLLRVLEEGEYEALGSNQLVSVDVRVVAATSRDLHAEVVAGRFRADLFYRLNVVTLQVPPLRERLGDLPALCEHLLDALCQKLGVPPREVTDAALQCLAQHDWPGNVRELRNVLERAVLLSDAELLGVEDVQAVLPPSAARVCLAKDAAVRDTVRPAQPVADKTLHSLEDDEAAEWTLAEAVEHAEQRALHRALAACGGNKAHAAVALGISRTSLYKKLAEHGLT